MILNDYQTWIEAQNTDGFTRVKEAEGYRLETEYADGAVVFHELEEYLIVEMRITEKKSGEDQFFLHFELNDLNHAEELYHEMIEALLDLKDRQKTKILLCCTAGLTTGFFAMKLNETAEFLNLDYEFNAVPYENVFEEGFHYQAVLLAPQTGYLLPKVKEIFTDKPVLQIPAKVFASYDAAGCVEFVKEELENYAKTEEEKALTRIRNCDEMKGRILCIAHVPDVEKTRVVYRLYEDGVVKDSGEVLKQKRSYRDIIDLLDSLYCSKDPFDIIGITVPGIVEREGYVFQNSGDEMDYGAYIREKYGIDCVLINNVNAAVYGIYASQEKYSSITLHSQPRGYVNGGIGSVVRGEPLLGRKGVAGELRYILPSMNYEEEPVLQKKMWQPEAVYDLVSKGLSLTIAMYDPEKIYVRCDLTPDMEEMKQYLLKLIPEKYIPELEYVSETDIAEYMVRGLLILCVEKLAQKK